jgi:hypothetical protein
VKKKANPPPRLVADTGPLTFVARNREHQLGACAARRGDNNPALRGGELGVFKNREAEDIAEKREPIIVARNKHCYRRKASEHGCALPAHMV